MPVFFAYRSFDLAPTGKYLKRFDDDTVLDWFRRHWEHLAVEDFDEADERLTALLGCDGWFLINPFHTAVEEESRTPKSMKSLLRFVEQCTGGGDCVGSAHSLQVFTEDDGEGGAVFYFDGHFLKECGGVAAYLLHEDWRLPSGQGEGGFVPDAETRALRPGGGTGSTYLVLLERESKYPLDDLAPAYRIDGIRLPELAQHLCSQSPGEGKSDWRFRLAQLPALMLAGVELADPMESAFLKAIQSAPSDAVNWHAWSDWRLERGSEPPGIGLLRDAFGRIARYPGQMQDAVPRDKDLATASRKLIELETKHRADLRKTTHSLIHVEDHLAQMCLDGSHLEEPYFGQWIFFDDLWASAYPDLANAILRFSARWDVLSED